MKIVYLDTSFLMDLMATAGVQGELVDASKAAALEQPGINLLNTFKDYMDASGYEVAITDVVYYEATQKNPFGNTTTTSQVPSERHREKLAE